MTDSPAIPADVLEREAIAIITDLIGPSEANSGTNVRVVEDHLRQFARALTPKADSPAIPDGEELQSTLAFVQAWMMSGDWEPNQWHRDFAAAIDARNRTPKPEDQPSDTVEDFLHQLRRVNTARYHAWVGDGEDAGILFDAAELGGEVGELLNVVKKLEREERGWRGSRAAPEDFADECADVLICLDKLARRRGVDLIAATVAKFNATSEKQGFLHKLAKPEDRASDMVRMREALRAEIINTPETADFLAGVPIEAMHQRERWGAAHDAGKTPEDWFWLIGYLAQKALRAQNVGDINKALHHTISTAAALANWHAAIAGIHTALRPGIDPAALHPGEPE